jgi:hypothetical protein
MHSFVTVGKHVNNTRAIARRLLSKEVPEATNTHKKMEEQGYGTVYTQR